MHPLEQLFKFRTHCLCGDPLTTIFQHSSYDDDYISAKPRGAYTHKDSNTIIFPLNISSTVVPYGEVDFNITTKIDSDQFELQAAYVSYKSKFHPTARETQYLVSDMNVSAEQFVENHFDSTVQNGLNFSLNRQCSHHNINNNKYGCEYFSRSTPMLFDLENRKTKGVRLIDEEFYLTDGKNRIHVITNFDTQVTTMVVGTYAFAISSQKFLKYPFESEFLLSKIKTLLTFS